MEEMIAKTGYSSIEIAIFSWVILVVIGIFLGAGEKRKIIVFSNFNDLGLTFLIPASLFLTMTVSFFVLADTYFMESLVLGLGLSVILLLMMIFRSFRSNNMNPFKAILAILTKLPLSILWVIALLAVLDPDGNTRQARRKNRGMALVILTLLTPIILVLIAEKKGSLFNPYSWVRGTRSSGI